MSQISHIKYKDVIKAWRFDANFFKPEYLSLREKINNIKNDKIISFLSNDKVITWHTPSKQNEKFYWWNIKFIKTDNLRENYINHNFDDYLSEQWNEEIKASQLKQWDIIVTIIWASEKVVWRVSIVREEDLPANINQNIALIRVNPEKINPDLLNIYLNCKYWRGYLHSLSRQTEQVNLNCREVERVLVPIFSKEIQQKISEIVQEAYDKKQKSKQLYQEAEDLLLIELWLKNHEISHTLFFLTTKKGIDNAWRYDADYFQPKYDELIKKIKDYKWGRDFLINCINIHDKNFIPKIWNLYKYIALSNISEQWFIPDYEESYWEELPTRARRLLKQWNVIISSVEGSLPSCAMIENEFDGTLCSNWFYVLDSEIINSECLLVLFKSSIIQALLKKWCSWTILASISKDELNKVPIPLIDQKIQKEISNKIKESFKLRNESKELLEQAKKMVEDEIERE